MSKAISGLFTILAVGVMGYACGALALSLAPLPATAFDPPQRAPAVAPVVVEARALPDGWAPLFGVVTEAPPPEPEPVVEAPPEENTTYWLTGVIAGAGLQSFAMILENDRDVVVRVGDTLVGGETVTAIDARGVWIEYEGTRELIPVPKTDFGTMISVEEDAGAAAAATLQPEITVPVEALNRGTIAELLSGSGRYERRDEGLELLSIRQGMLFDQMGLRPGDTILSLNGQAPDGLDLLANTPDTDLLSGAFELEILRDGARQTVKVTLEQSS